MEKISFAKAQNLSAIEIRNFIRKESYVNHTAGLAANKLQTNIVIVPKEFSEDFHNFCKKPIEIIHMTILFIKMFLRSKNAPMISIT